jgi:seryl-tRNA synthetase
LHTEKKASEEQTVHLKKDAADLSEKITLLRKKQNDARKNNQSKLLKEEENARLLAILRKKEKEVEQTRQKYNSALTELSDANKRTETLEKELVKITKDKIRPDTRERVNANTVTPPHDQSPLPGN